MKDYPDASCGNALGEAIADQFTTDTLCDKFWTHVLKILSDIFEFDDLIAEFNRLQSKFRPDSYGKRSRGMLVNPEGKEEVLSELLIVFDEARNLLEDLFLALRDAHRRLMPRNCFLVFVDTLSTVDTFGPSTFLDPSVSFKYEPVGCFPARIDRFNALLPSFFPTLNCDIFHSKEDLEDMEDLQQRL